MQELMFVLPLSLLFVGGISSRVVLLMLDYKEDLRVFARRIRND